MIEMREIRLGNLINVRGDATRKRAGTYLFVTPRVISDIVTGHAVDYESILLIPEWLGKCGFKYDEYHFKHENRHHIVCHPEGGFVYRVPGVSLVEVKYVHQLQNLFFALTGTELNIRL
jgi:hypothetical protein